MLEADTTSDKDNISYINGNSQRDDFTNTQRSSINTPSKFILFLFNFYYLRKLYLYYHKLELIGNLISFSYQMEK